MNEKRENKSWKVSPLARPEAVISGGTYRFTVLTDRLIRMEYRADGQFMDEPTQCVICREFPVTDYRVREEVDQLEVVTEKLHLYYDKQPFSREGLSIQLTEGYAVYGSVWHYQDEIRDLGGTIQTLDNVDGAVELDHGLMSRDGFSILDDSHSAILSEDGWVRPADGKGVDLYFFGYGHDYQGCLKDFYQLSGNTPLLPRYTLGNWWSRFYPYTEESYLQLMDRFQEKEIPIATAVIDMDWHLTRIPEKYGSGWTGYTWNPEFFPDPERFMRELHNRGMHVTLNVHPADGVRAHEEQYLPMAKALGVDHEKEDKIPFDVSDRRFMEAYFQYLHHPNEEKGVDFWWLDWQQGNRSGIRGIDTLWLLNHLHFLDSARNQKRPLTFSRYAGIGSHRYPIGFSGDSISSWDSLRFQPYFTANASNVGYSWWSHDIGGHQKGIRDDEMVVRWIQFGVFSPIMRLHSTASEFYGKEPWNYDRIAESVITRYLQLRHQLIPYLYTQNYRTHREGIPLIQPIYYVHDTEEAYEVPNEYYFGEKLIVCPITSPADRRTRMAGFDAWIPEGRYFDVFTGQVYKGDRRIVLYRDIENIPVLAAAGAIVPMAGDPMQSHRQNPKDLEVQVFYGADGTFELYEDDCKEQMESQVAVTKFTYEQGEQIRFSMNVTGDRKVVIPKDRVYHIHFRGVNMLEHVKVQSESAHTYSVSYDAEKREGIVSVEAQEMESFVITADVFQMRPLQPDKTRLLFDMLQKAQIEYQLKEKIYHLYRKESSHERILSELCSLKLAPELYGAVVEIITSDI